MTTVTTDICTLVWPLLRDEDNAVHAASTESGLWIVGWNPSGLSVVAVWFIDAPSLDEAAARLDRVKTALRSVYTAPNVPRYADLQILGYVQSTPGSALAAQAVAPAALSSSNGHSNSGNGNGHSSSGVKARANHRRAGSLVPHPHDHMGDCLFRTVTPTYAEPIVADAAVSLPTPASLRSGVELSPSLPVCPALRDVAVRAMRQRSDIWLELHCGPVLDEVWCCGYRVQPCQLLVLRCGAEAHGYSVHPVVYTATALYHSTRDVQSLRRGVRAVCVPGAQSSVEGVLLPAVMHGESAPMMRCTVAAPPSRHSIDAHRDKEDSHHRHEEHTAHSTYAQSIFTTLTANTSMYTIGHEGEEQQQQPQQEHHQEEQQHQQHQEEQQQRQERKHDGFNGQVGSFGEQNRVEYAMQHVGNRSCHGSSDIWCGDNPVVPTHPEARDSSSRRRRMSREAKEQSVPAQPHPPPPPPRVPGSRHASPSSALPVGYSPTYCLAPESRGAGCVWRRTARRDSTVSTSGAPARMVEEKEEEEGGRRCGGDEGPTDSALLADVTIPTASPSAPPLHSCHAGKSPPPAAQRTGSSMLPNRPHAAIPTRPQPPHRHTRATAAAMDSIAHGSSNDHCVVCAEAAAAVAAAAAAEEDGDEVGHVEDGTDELRGGSHVPWTRNSSISSVDASDPTQRGANRGASTRGTNFLASLSCSLDGTLHSADAHPVPQPPSPQASSTPTRRVRSHPIAVGAAAGGLPAPRLRRAAHLLQTRDDGSMPVSDAAEEEEEEEEEDEMEYEMDEEEEEEEMDEEEEEEACEWAPGQPSHWPPPPYRHRRRRQQRSSSTISLSCPTSALPYTNPRHHHHHHHHPHNSSHGSPPHRHPHRLRHHSMRSFGANTSAELSNSVSSAMQHAMGGAGPNTADGGAGGGAAGDSVPTAAPPPAPPSAVRSTRMCAALPARPPRLDFPRSVDGAEIGTMLMVSRAGVAVRHALEQQAAAAVVRRAREQQTRIGEGEGEREGTGDADDARQRDQSVGVKGSGSVWARLRREGSVSAATAMAACTSAHTPTDTVASPTRLPATPLYRCAGGLVVAPATWPVRPSSHAALARTATALTVVMALLHRVVNVLAVGSPFSFTMSMLELRLRELVNFLALLLGHTHSCGLHPILPHVLSRCHSSRVVCLASYATRAITDSVLGICVSLLLVMGGPPVHAMAHRVARYFLYELHKSYMDWFDGYPAGLKLNDDLNKALCFVAKLVLNLFDWLMRCAPPEWFGPLMRSYGYHEGDGACIGFAGNSSAGAGVAMRRANCYGSNFTSGCGTEVTYWSPVAGDGSAPLSARATDTVTYWWILQAYYVLTSCCMMGASVGLAFVGDMASLTSIALRTLYLAIALIYRFIVLMLGNLYSQFRGQRYNPLRQRVDEYDFTLDQQLIATFLFMVCVFLFPTIAVYFVYFAFVRLTIQFVQSLFVSLAHVVMYLPTFPLVYWLLYRKTLRGGVVLSPPVVVQYDGVMTSGSKAGAAVSADAAAASGRRHRAANGVATSANGAVIADAADDDAAAGGRKNSSAARDQREPVSNTVEVTLCSVALPLRFMLTDAAVVLRELTMLFRPSLVLGVSAREKLDKTPHVLDILVPHLRANCVDPPCTLSAPTPVDKSESTR